VSFAISPEQEVVILLTLAVNLNLGKSEFGHYFIYINDFEKRVYRKYNDEAVSEVTDLDEVLGVKDSVATPYLLCYVSADQTDLMESVCREIQETPT
jgi:ubiquitin carboxyl-terminal hydrolase 25